MYLTVLGGYMVWRIKTIGLVQLIKIEPKPSLIFGIIIEIYIYEELDLNFIYV
jgi:hypothetical protein